MSKSNNIFTNSENFTVIDLKRILYFFTFIFSFGLTEFGRNVYRPFIYENNINDFGFADSIGNSGGILVQIFFGLTFFNSPFKKGFRLITLFVIGYIFYEILQPYLPKGVFDWKDIYGTLIGGLLGLMLYIIINKSIKNNKVLFHF